MGDILNGVNYTVPLNVCFCAKNAVVVLCPTREPASSVASVEGLAVYVGG